MAVCVSVCVCGGVYVGECMWVSDKFTTGHMTVGQADLV